MVAALAYSICALGALSFGRVAEPSGSYDREWSYGGTSIGAFLVKEHGNGHQTWTFCMSRGMMSEIPHSAFHLWSDWASGMEFKRVPDVGFVPMGKRNRQPTGPEKELLTVLTVSDASEVKVFADSSIAITLARPGAAYAAGTRRRLVLEDGPPQAGEDRLDVLAKVLVTH